MIANHAEGTFELLRYSLGGNRPSQTDPLTRSPTRVHGIGLDARLIKGGISLVASTIPDETVSRGGCVVEGPERIVDGRVEGALERIYRTVSHG